LQQKQIKNIENGLDPLPAAGRPPKIRHGRRKERARGVYSRGVMLKKYIEFIE